MACAPTQSLLAVGTASGAIYIFGAGGVETNFPNSSRGIKIQHLAFKPGSGILCVVGQSLSTRSVESPLIIVPPARFAKFIVHLGSHQIGARQANEGLYDIHAFKSHVRLLSTLLVEVSDRRYPISSFEIDAFPFTAASRLPLPFPSSSSAVATVPSTCTTYRVRLSDDDNRLLVPVDTRHSHPIHCHRCHDPPQRQNSESLDSSRGITTQNRQRERSTSQLRVCRLLVHCLTSRLIATTAPSAQTSNYIRSIPA